jgi:energy-coupling factor transporter ATP-binding protein EcfA2
LLPEFNALENVMMPGLIQGLPRAQIEKRARSLLSDVGLAPRMTHRPGELSGGEQQRVALARALVLEPKLILADEPTGNLDTATSDAIHNLFFDINKKHGTTIVVVTHNLKLAEQMPRVIRMLDGKVVEDSGAHRAPFEVEERVLERSRAIAKVAYAGFGLRTAARVVDSLFMWLLAAAAGVGVGYLTRNMADNAHFDRLLDWKWIALALFVGFTTQLLYHMIAETMGGATFAKMLFGIRVRDESLDGSRFGAAILRNVLVFVDSILFGLVAYIGMKGSLLRQRFGDGLAQTVVVHAKSLPEGDGGASIAGAALGAAVYLVLIAIWTIVFLRA